MGIQQEYGTVRVIGLLLFYFCYRFCAGGKFGFTQRLICPWSFFQNEGSNILVEPMCLLTDQSVVCVNVCEYWEAINESYLKKLQNLFRHRHGKDS